MIARQIHLEVDDDDVQELLDSPNQELTIDERICVSTLILSDSLDNWVQLENQITVTNLTEGLSLVAKGSQILENIVFNEQRISATKLLGCYEGILREEKKSLTRQTTLLNLMKTSTSV